MKEETKKELEQLGLRIQSRSLSQNPTDEEIARAFEEFQKDQKGLEDLLVRDLSFAQKIIFAVMKRAIRFANWILPKSVIKI